MSCRCKRGKKSRSRSIPPVPSSGCPECFRGPVIPTSCIASSMIRTRDCGGTVTFDHIPAGLAVFVDANCLVYDATYDPTYGPACKRLLERIENKELPGY